MKVLHLTPGLPLPPDSGGRICTWNLIQADARFAETGIISFCETPPDGVTLSALKSVCREVQVVRRPRTLDGLVGGARSLLSNMAMNMAKYRWSEFSSAVVECVERWKPDVIVAHHLHMGSYLRDVTGPVTILREHNVDSDLMARYADTLRNPALASFARTQAEKIREMESRLCPAVDRCMMITRDDALTLREIAPNARVSVVPGVIDVETYAPVKAPTDGDPLIVTAGSFNFRPTGEGLVEFVDRTWPRIVKAFPKARLRVIGNCPERLKKRIFKPGVDVLGRVDQVRPYLNGAHAFVVPLRVGSGMRMRILESLAWEIPTVTTPLGCKGIAVEDGRHVLIAESPEAMAAGIVRIMKDHTLARNLRREGRRLVEKYYSLSTSQYLTSRIYTKCLEPAAAGQPVID